MNSSQLVMSKQPEKWKMAIVVWIAIYPTITLLFFFFGNHFSRIASLPVRTFCITILVVPLMVFMIVPLLNRVLHRWLYR